MSYPCLLLATAKINLIPTVTRTIMFMSTKPENSITLPIFIPSNEYCQLLTYKKPIQLYILLYLTQAENSVSFTEKPCREMNLKLLASKDFISLKFLANLFCGQIIVAQQNGK